MKKLFLIVAAMFAAVSFSRLVPMMMTMAGKRLLPKNGLNR